MRIAPSAPVLMASILCAFLLHGCAGPSGLAEPAGPGGLNVVELGADPTGAKDCTQLLQEVHARKQRVYYPNGTYRFNGTSLDFSGGVEGEAVRGIFDDYNGATQTAAFYARIAQHFQAAGFGGVALFARHATADKLMSYADLERQGVLYFNASYAEDHSQGKTYPERVANFAPPNDPHTIIGTATALHTHTPHPSKWVCSGHTPDLFRDELRKAVAHVQAQSMLRIVTCYNVAEWAEGGPGLQPNMQDRFGYLDAVKAAVVLPPDSAPRENNVFRP